MPRVVTGFLINSGVVITSLTLAVIGFEAFLRADAAWRAPTTQTTAKTLIAPARGALDDVPVDLLANAESRYRFITMPDEWRLRPINAAGASRAYIWHDVLHVYDQHGMRRTTPFPEKRQNTYRIMVVGDSQTYGVGIRFEDTFVSLLERWLSSDYRIEVLNLGRLGFQSEDTLLAIREFTPSLVPDLVIYAVCLNDFLPSGVRQYDNVNKYSFPLPVAVKNFLIERTRVGALTSEFYNATLRNFQLRFDFYDDILSDFDGYQRRFARDVANMNAVIRAAGLPSLVAMVVDQYPVYGQRGQRIAQAAEKYLRAAGAVVIDTEDYYRRYSHQSLSVSPWEGHPNEIANFIWARMIMQHLRERDDLKAFRR